MIEKYPIYSELKKMLVNYNTFIPATKKEYLLWWELKILDNNENQFNTQQKLYNFCKPYIIAEIGSNHNGDLELAKKLISEAKDAGADCIKCQSWTAETIFLEKNIKIIF